MPSTLVWFAFAILALWGVTIAIESARTRRRLASLRREWGQPRERDRDMAVLAATTREGETPWCDDPLDDRSWNDLNLDEVFSILDRTESVVGQQALYARLRSTPQAAHLDAFDTLVSHVTADVAFRERAQIALGRLRAPAGYHLWSLTQPGTLDAAPWQALFPIAALAMATLLVLAPIWPPAILLLVIGSVASLVARASAAASLRVVTGAFGQLATLIAAARVVTACPDSAAALTGTLRNDVPRLARLRRIASWAGRESGAATAGDLGALVLEYLNMVFWLDANALFFGARELRSRAPELRRVIAAVGEVDAAVSIASYRAGTSGWTRPVFSSAGPVRVIDVRHPLLADAVPASITLQPPSGILITGSNMSGKSTFLRTMGVTVVMAQTINTCLAERYEAPVLSVRSCVGLADDPATGKSYYLVEVDAVLGLVRAAQTSTPHLFLFDELFRGTNAVERIAGAEAVLLTLLDAGGVPVPHVVIAATHDLELVELLRGRYEPYHFADASVGTELMFDYQLHKGAATTRNAIALLERRGAPAALVARALARARQLDSLSSS